MQSKKVESTTELIIIEQFQKGMKKSMKFYLEQTPHLELLQSEVTGFLVENGAKKLLNFLNRCATMALL